MKNKKIKLLFFLHSLRGGGAERVVTILLRHLDPNLFEINFVLVIKDGQLINELPENTKVYEIKVSRTVMAIPDLIFLIHSLEPDIVFSTLTNLIVGAIALLSGILFSNKIKFIAREYLLPSLLHKEGNYYWITQIAYKLLYPVFDCIICQSMDMKKDLTVNFGVKHDVITIINNPVDIKRINELSKTSHAIFYDKGIHLVAAGRLVYQKGFDLLILTISKLPDNFTLTILGSGKEKTNLINLSERQGVRDRVFFAGFKPNPYPYFAQADIFVLSSRYEGFPNVLLEALSCGTPAVAFDCPGGINEIIQDGKNGFLAKSENVIDLAKKIELCAKFNFNSNFIKDSIAAKYSIEKILPRYNELFRNMVLTQSQIYGPMWL